MQPLPASLTQAIQQFAKQITTWLEIALYHLPEELQNKKISGIKESPGFFEILLILLITKNTPLLHPSTPHGANFMILKGGINLNINMGQTLN